jgi:hypothetical protein
MNELLFLVFASSLGEIFDI